MEAVKSFDFHIDLDNCEQLYDYGRFEYISRPSGGWDLDMLAQTRQEDPVFEDETTLLMMKKMYRSHRQKGALEKDSDSTKSKKEEKLTFDSFSAFSDSKPMLPKWVFPIFKPGDIVKGFVHLELKENVEAERVKIKFKGHASTNIRIYHKHGYYDDIGEEVYVKEKQTVWQKTGTQDTSAVPLTSANVPTANVLAAGVHKFPFDFRIPDDARQSVPNLVYGFFDDDWAFISYFFKATIDKGKTLKWGNILAHHGIWVCRDYDIATSILELDPVQEEKVQSTGVISKGKVSCKIQMPARAYVRTDNIPVQLEISNESGGIIDGVKVRVMLTGRYRSKPKSWHGSKSIKVRGHCCRGGPIANGEHPQLSFVVPLEFREDGVDGNLIPCGTLNNCNIIDVEYNLCVSLKRKGLHRDVDVKVPISVGSRNSREEPLYPQLT